MGCGKPKEGRMSNLLAREQGTQGIVWFESGAPKIYEHRVRIAALSWPTCMPKQRDCKPIADGDRRNFPESPGLLAGNNRAG
jgi:hypothetical protein